MATTNNPIESYCGANCLYPSGYALRRGILLQIEVAAGENGHRRNLKNCLEEKC